MMPPRVLAKTLRGQKGETTKNKRRDIFSLKKCGNYFIPLSVVEMEKHDAILGAKKK